LKVAGFTIVRNAVKFDYPAVEAISSILPICDIVYVGVGNSDDETRQLIQGIGSPKIVIMDAVWDDSLREGGKVLAIETNKVFDNIPLEYDWCFYIQADECIHEEDYPRIHSAMKSAVKEKSVDGLLFRYKHFYGQYNYVGVGRRWYSNEIRIIRNDKRIRSWKDAQGFRKTDGSKLCVADTGAFIYHYGWVKPPKAQQAKQQSFHKMWHDDEWMKKNVGNAAEFDYSNIDLLDMYKGSHPAVMKPRIGKANWAFIYDKSKVKRNLKYRILYFIERLTGWRIGENRNYQLKTRYRG
jgi:hypothetical protein